MADGFDKQLGKYLLKSQLGHGGMGVVYLALDTRLKRDVALKILPRTMSADKAALDRFFLEARTVARLNHPNVVAIHDVDQDRGYSFLAMELLTGGTLQQAIQHGPLSWGEATNVILQTCRGLAAAHDAGLIHRDIKPSNIMKASNGVIKLTDFGLAKVVDEASGTNPLTKSNLIVGTPHYMSPEQCGGEHLDPRSDLYSLGVTYFTLLIGAPPFTHLPVLQVMFAHCSKPTPDPCRLRPDLPTECGQIVMKAMAKNRKDRFASASEMLAALEKLAVRIPTQVVATSPLRNAISPIVNPNIEPPPTERFDLDPSTDTLPVPSPRHHGKRAAFGIAAAIFGVLLVLVLMLTVGNPFQKAKPVDGQPDARLETHLEPKTELPVGNAQIRSVTFAADGQSLFAGALDGSVNQWDIANGNIRRKLAGTKLGIRAVAANARWLAAGGVAKTVWLWKLDADQPHVALADFAGEISALAFSPDGRRLAVGTYGEVRLYELNEKGAKLIKVLGTSVAEPVCYMVMSVAFSSDSQFIAATTWTKKRVFAWNTSTGTLRATSPEMEDIPMVVTFVPGQNQIVIGLQHKGVRLWDIGKAEARTIRSSAATHARSLVVMPDGRTAIVVGEWGGNIRLFDLDPDAPVRLVQRAAAASTVTAAISPDGKLLASGGGGDEGANRGYLHLFDIVRRKAE